MHDPAFEHGPPDAGVAAGDDSSLSDGRQILGVGWLHLGIRRVAVDLAIAYSERPGIGAAKPGGGFDHRVQHRLDIGGRAADDVKHLGCRGLVFESLVALGSAFGKLTLQIGYELLGIG